MSSTNTPRTRHHALFGNQGIPPCCQQSGRRLDRLLRWADGGAEQTAGHAAGLREKGRISGGAGLLLQRPLRRDWAGPPVKRPSRCPAERRAVPGEWPDQGDRPHIVRRNSAHSVPAWRRGLRSAPFLLPLPTGTASLGSGGGPIGCPAGKRTGPGRRAAGHPQGVRRRRKRQSRQRRTQGGGPYGLFYR